jgi:hypothetical protein
MKKNGFFLHFCKHSSFHCFFFLFPGLHLYNHSSCQCDKEVEVENEEVIRVYACRFGDWC